MDERGSSVLFDPRFIRFKNFDDWVDAVHEGVRVLVENGKASWKLEKMIFTLIRDFGNDFILGDGLAFIDVPANEYCSEPCASIILLENELIFNQQIGKRAKIIITLSVPTAKDHFELIMQFGKFLGDPKFKSQAFYAKSVDEFLEVVQKFQ